MAVRIPKAILKEAGMDEGEDLSVTAKAGRIAIEKARPKLTVEKLLADIDSQNLHGEQDWGRPVGNEVW